MSRMLSLMSVPGCCKTAAVVIPLLLLLQVELSRTSSCGIEFDMVVAVDTSSSCTEPEFQQLLTEVKGIVSGFPVGQEKNRLALISMSQSVQILANFNNVNSLTDFNSAVDRLRLTAGQTDISTGMKRARESVLNTARRAPTSRILLLVKDRRCNADSRADSDTAELSSIASEAAAVRVMNCSIHAVGTGGLWSSNDLKSLFGTDYLLFKNKNKAMESAKSMNNKLCPLPNCTKSISTGICFGNVRQIKTVVGAAVQNSFDEAGFCRQEVTRSFSWCSEKQSCNKIDRSIGTCESDRNVTIVDMWQFFNRKSQSCVTHEEKHRVACAQSRECKSQVADVFLLLDRSGSLYHFYNTLVNAAMVLIEPLHIGANNVHIGVASFSKGPLATTVDLGTEFNKSKILERVDAMRNQTNFSYTYTGDALKQVKRIFDTKGRSGVIKAIILITDGQSNDPPDVAIIGSELKRAGFTIYAVGVKPKAGRLNLKELNMLTSPESDKNLFILDNFNELSSWAIKFSNQLCVELAPPNPKLCDADVQYKLITSCYYDYQTATISRLATTIKYKYNAAGKCFKQFESSMIPECKDVCIDPVDGSEHREGETWTNMCHEFHCNKGGKTTIPAKTTKCVAADYSCKSIGSAAFQCRNPEGEMIGNCQCVDRNGEAVLVINSPS